MLQLHNATIEGKRADSIECFAHKEQISLITDQNVTMVNFNS